jgi:cell division septation protein DedD
MLDFVGTVREGHLAQDEYYYEIQLTNKQLVFYFMAGAAFLVMSFLAGIVVGRGVDQSAEASTTGTTVARAAQPSEDKIVTEEPPASKPQAPSTDSLAYSKRLEADRVDNTLEKPATAPVEPVRQAANVAPVTVVADPPHAAANTKPAGTTKRPVSAAAVASAPQQHPSNTAKPAAAVKPAPVAPAAGAFAIQVGAFKDRATADSIVGRLKGKGFTAYVVSPESTAGLFNVRVGGFHERPAAEKVEARLRDEEKFKPFIVKQ